jgi:hypothetical protein
MINGKDGQDSGMPFVLIDENRAMRSVSYSDRLVFLLAGRELAGDTGRNQSSPHRLLRTRSERYIQVYDMRSLVLVTNARRHDKTQYGR